MLIFLYIILFLFLCVYDIIFILYVGKLKLSEDGVFVKDNIVRSDRVEILILV